MLQEVKTGSQLVSVHRCEVEKAAPENEKKISKYIFFLLSLETGKGHMLHPFSCFVQLICMLKVD